MLSGYKIGEGLIGIITTRKSSLLEEDLGPQVYPRGRSRSTTKRGQKRVMV